MDRLPTKSLRLFYALWPDEHCRAALAQLQTRVEGRKIPYQNLHMTLVFLGEQAETSLPVLHDILKQTPAFSIPLVLDRIGYFSRKKIAWTGMQQAPDALLALRQHLTNELARYQIAFEHSADFKAHVTLARDADTPQELPFTPIRWTNYELVLVQSTPGQHGPSYRILRPD